MLFVGIKPWPHLGVNLKTHSFAHFCRNFLVFFLVFVPKCKKAYFDQHLENAAPNYWSKYKTLVFCRNVSGPLVIVLLWVCVIASVIAIDGTEKIWTYLGFLIFFLVVTIQLKIFELVIVTLQIIYRFQSI